MLEAELLRDAACQGEDAEVVAHPFLLLRAVLPPADTVPECVERAGVRRSETLVKKALVVFRYVSSRGSGEARCVAPRSRARARA